MAQNFKHWQDETGCFTGAGLGGSHQVAAA
jgi:hypothetical protein